MLKDKNSNQNIEEMTDSRADNLVVKIMTEKINESYKDLNNEQKHILGQYAVYSSNNDNKSLATFLKTIKENSLKSLGSLKETTDNTVLLSKVDKVIENVKSLAESNITDSDLAKYLKVSELKSQIGVIKWVIKFY